MIAQWMLKRLKRLDRALALPIVILLAFMAQDAVAQSSWRYLRPQQIKNVEPVVPPLEVDTTLDVSGLMFPSYYYGPVVYDHYIIFDSVPQFPVPELKISTKEPIPDSLQAPEPRPVTAWVDDRLASAKKFWELRQRYMINHPDQVKYNTLFLPEPPKEYRAVVDPTKYTITIEEISVDKKKAMDDVPDAVIQRRNWIKSFAGSVQFSQAYISPNWYQGGNNNLNMLINLLYSVKLNPAFYPNLLFENTIQYKLGLNSAPDDSIRNYSISEDLFQVNSKFGVKAAKRWFYSVTAQFKTQLLHNYESNSRDLTAAILSPGELNVGLGMTYNYAAPSGKFTFDVSISPLSYNLKTLINSKMDPESYGLDPGHKTLSQYGSSAEAKMMVKISREITWNSRLFVFTDYHSAQGDWENTFDFALNRWISTKLYIHLRYDSTTPYTVDTRWHKWQLKEILSFGFSYTYATP